MQLNTWNLCLISNPGNFSNLICYISETEGRKKLKFGEVSFHICQIFLKENWAKSFSTWIPF